MSDLDEIRTRRAAERDRLAKAEAAHIRLDEHFEVVRQALNPTADDENLRLLDLAKKRTGQLAEAVAALRNERLTVEELKTKLAEAQKSAAAWEIQAQDLRDRLIALEHGNVPVVILKVEDLSDEMRAQHLGFSDGKNDVPRKAKTEIAAILDSPVSKEVLAMAYDGGFGRGRATVKSS